MQTRSQIKSVGDLLAKKPSEFSFVDPALISAPNTQILQLNGQARQVQDPGRMLKSQQGTERTSFARVLLSAFEKGPNGEHVYKMHSDDRFRFVGTWVNAASGNGTRPETSTVSDFLEFTFTGTGANLMLAFAQGAAVDIRYTVDGGSESANIIPGSGTMSTFLNGRNQRINHVIPIVAGLTYGTHTIKLRHVANGFSPSGIEILNENSQIRITAGETFANGRKYVQSAIELLDNNTSFDGSPSLNGRGGKVAIYKTTDGRSGKVIQQVDSTAQYLSATDHTNEEPIKRINWRTFGMQLGSDFSTLSTSLADRAFVLEDNVTMLQGHNVLNDSGEDGFRMGGVSGNTVTFSWVGTGLDILTYEDSGQQTSDLIIDGVTVSSTYGSSLSSRRFVQKICSGLPYGSHTVRWSTTTAASGNYHFVDFIVYGPKTPSIPSGATKVAEYCLPASYDGTTATSNSNFAIPRGVIARSMIRDVAYVGANWAVNQANDVFSGWDTNTTTNNSQPYRISFVGTGIVIHQEASGAGTYDFSVTIDGALNATGVARANASNLGGGSYRSTSTTNPQACRVEFTGLTYGHHTVVVQRTAGTGNFFVQGYNIITPIHINTDYINGNCGVKSSLVLNKNTALGGPDLSKARAWAIVDLNNTGNMLKASYNVASVLRLGTGNFVVFFSKPFKNRNYAMVASSMTITTTNSMVCVDVGTNNPGWCGVFVRSDSGTANDSTHVSVAFFGELDDEESN